jgi:hypothetical protein
MGPIYLRSLYGKLDTNILHQLHYEGMLAYITEKHNMSEVKLKGINLDGLWYHMQSQKIQQHSQPDRI